LHTEAQNTAKRINKSNIEAIIERRNINNNNNNNITIDISINDNIISKASSSFSLSHFLWQYVKVLE